MSAQKPDKSNKLLLVDDDEVFCHLLSRALSKRGFEVCVAHSADEGLAAARQHSPLYAVVDLNMPGPSGLTLIEGLKEICMQTSIVVLTGYASVATAVEAIKLGATHYLTKPADPDEIVAMLGRKAGNASAHVMENTISVDRLEWEHIQKVLVANDRNVSATARALGMHRRTLQRKLNKRPVKE